MSRVKDNWYYRIELPDGSFTEGRPHGNLALCRQFFPRIQKSGLRVLDIGTQEFVAPVLFQRQGAGEIVAYDRLNLENRRQIVANAYRVNFHYASGMPLLGLKEYLIDVGISPLFDYVNFCGVLYHMIDPLAGLGMARSFLRRGGIMLLETSVSLEPGFIAQVNHGGKLYPGSNYFQLSLETVDYWVRMLRMEILDAAFLGGKGKIGRMVAVCRAVDKPVAEADDAWMTLPFAAMDFEPYGLRYSELNSTMPPVEYCGDARPKAVQRPGLNSIDLWQTYERMGATPFDKELTELRLTHTV